jgi:hypothetical protein
LEHLTRISGEGPDEEGYDPAKNHPKAMNPDSDHTSHMGSPLYFHITRYVLKRRREDTFWGAKSESRVSAPFSASKSV